MIPRRCYRLFLRERGSTYALPLLLTAPFYLIWILAVFEIALLLISRMGAQAATYHAARSAAMWPPEIAAKKAERAAWTAIAAFVGDRPSELDAGGPVPSHAAAWAQEYAAALSRTPNAMKSELLNRRFLTAAARTAVVYEYFGPPGQRSIRVVVTYRAALSLPIASRFLDPDGIAPFEYPLQVAVTLPAETPRSATETLGIDYEPDLLARGEKP